jgi:hypothetical protein
MWNSYVQAAEVSQRRTTVSSKCFQLYYTCSERDFSIVLPPCPFHFPPLIVTFLKLAVILRPVYPHGRGWQLAVIRCDQPECPLHWLLTCCRFTRMSTKSDYCPGTGIIYRAAEVCVCVCPSTKILNEQTDFKKRVWTPRYWKPLYLTHYGSELWRVNSYKKDFG